MNCPRGAVACCSGLLACTGCVPPEVSWSTARSSETAAFSAEALDDVQSSWKSLERVESVERFLADYASGLAMLVPSICVFLRRRSGALVGTGRDALSPAPNGPPPTATAGGSRLSAEEARPTAAAANASAMAPQVVMALWFPSFSVPARLFNSAIRRIMSSTMVSTFW